jgi:hypothetical protein
MGAFVTLLLLLFCFSFKTILIRYRTNYSVAEKIGYIRGKNVVTLMTLA